MFCDICEANYRLTVKCPKCQQNCCYTDLEWHGFDENRDCIDPDEWAAVKEES
jgi:hypothetical protein